MTAALAGIVALAGGALTFVMSSAAVGVTWRMGALRVARLHPRSRAHVLACLRLLPSAAAIVSATAVAIAFVRHEPENARETAGLVLVGCALYSAVLLARSARRVAIARRETARALGRWRQERATQTSSRLPITLIDTTFPVVAVVGVWRPQLYIARDVIASCDAVELDAMIAHELAHVAARDNLTRLLFVCAPIAPGCQATAAAIEHAWTRAAEECADDDARNGGRASLALASALTKLARLAAGGEPPLVHASAILSGSGLEHRVRRLLAPAPSGDPARLRAVLMLSAALLTIAAVSSPAQHQLYEFAEYCVHFLP
jgi:beta-lactamase regulating signal transducer with metallopeptidase domain